MNYTAQSECTFNKTLEKLQNEAAENGFRVLHVHNVQQTLADKGFNIGKFSIVEVCNAKFAYKLLTKEIEYGTMLPCKINIYEDKGKVWISTPLPTDMVERFEMAGAKEVAAEVEIILKKVIDSAI